MGGNWAEEEVGRVCVSTFFFGVCEEGWGGKGRMHAEAMFFVVKLHWDHSHGLHLGY